MTSLLDTFKTLSGEQLTEAISVRDDVVDSLLDELESALGMYSGRVKLQAFDKNAGEDTVIIAMTNIDLRLGTVKAKFKIESHVVHTGYNIKAKRYVVNFTPLTGAFTQKEVKAVLDKVEKDFSESAERSR